MSRISLRNIKISKSLSRETTAFTATVLLDGTPVCTVENDGHGGCHNYYSIGKNTYKSIQSLHEIAKSESDETFSPLEFLIDNLLFKYEVDKLVKNKQKDAIVFSTPTGSIFEPQTISWIKFRITIEEILKKGDGKNFLLQQIEKNVPKDGKILNTNLNL